MTQYMIGCHSLIMFFFFFFGFNSSQVFFHSRFINMKKRVETKSRTRPFPLIKSKERLLLIRTNSPSNLQLLIKLLIVGEIRKQRETIKMRKARWIGYVLRHDGLMKDVLEGRMEGKWTKREKENNDDGWHQGW